MDSSNPMVTDSLGQTQRNMNKQKYVNVGKRQGKGWVWKGDNRQQSRCGSDQKALCVCVCVCVCVCTRVPKSKFNSIFKRKGKYPSTNPTKDLYPECVMNCKSMINKLRSWRDGSVVNSTDCFCRRPGFGSQHPHGIHNFSSKRFNALSCPLLILLN